AKAAMPGGWVADRWGVPSRATRLHAAFLLLFFFSSRRRHTRSYGDWSSDVCSSDLSTCTARRASRWHRSWATAWWPAICRGRSRSEERRVGKEWRGRWAPGDEKEKRKGGQSLAGVTTGRVPSATGEHMHQIAPGAAE